MLETVLWFSEADETENLIENSNLIHELSKLLSLLKKCTASICDVCTIME